MIVLDVEQGTPEWFAARLGIPTASMFDKILSPTGKVSAQANGYANLLIAEILTGTPQGFTGNQWTDRGTELEPEARNYYEFLTGAEVLQVGFVLRDDRRVGCSPDGMVGGDGLLEIKCPKPETHVSNLLCGKVPTEYLSQIQGQLYLCERQWCDFLSYCPGMPALLCRVEANTQWHADFEAQLKLFHVEMGAKLERLRHLVQI